MVTKRDKYQKIVDNYLEEHKDEETISITVTADTNYLRATSYLEGYNDGMCEAIKRLKPNSNANS
jgi:hypothetical protein